MSNLPELWTALHAQVKALRYHRPVVTQVECGVWCIYAPKSGCQVIGGILDRNKAIHLAKATYGKEPIVSDKIFAVHKGQSPLPIKREGDYFSSEVKEWLVQADQEVKSQKAQGEIHE